MLVSFDLCSQGCALTDHFRVDMDRGAIPEAGDLFTLVEGDRVCFRDLMVTAKHFTYDLLSEQLTCSVSLQTAKDFEYASACREDTSP